MQIKLNESLFACCCVVCVCVLTSNSASKSGRGTRRTNKTRVTYFIFLPHTNTASDPKEAIVSTEREETGREKRFACLHPFLIGRADLFLRERGSMQHAAFFVVMLREADHGDAL